MTTPEMKALLPPSTAFTPPFKIARGHEGYQLENGAGEMLCDGMRAQDASDLLGIVKAFFTRPTPQPSSEYEKVKEVLEEQMRGAEWRKANEESWNGCDDEALDRLYAVINTLKSHPTPAKEKP